MSTTDKEANILKAIEFRNIYWDYYLILEGDVLEIEPYVSFHPDNYCCFSNQFIKLYLSICSEIDVICREYCYLKNIGNLPGSCDRFNIKDYAKNVLGKHPEISQQKVAIQKSGYELTPWKDWSVDFNDHKNNKNPKNTTPDWWKKYNKVKHNRSDKYAKDENKYNYQHANLYNVLNALAALYVLEKYYYKDLAERVAPIGKSPYIPLTPSSKLFGFFDFDIRYMALGPHPMY